MLCVKKFENYSDATFFLFFFTHNFNFLVYLLLFYSTYFNVLKKITVNLILHYIRTLYKVFFLNVCLFFVKTRMTIFIKTKFKISDD